LPPLLALGSNYYYLKKIIAKMLHLIQRCTIMNRFGRFLGRISAETCLKMDYFGSKSPKIALPPDTLNSGGWGLRPQTPVRLND